MPQRSNRRRSARGDRADGLEEFRDDGDEALGGIWVGDVVALTNDAPGEGFIDIMHDLRDMALASPEVHEIVGTGFDYRTMKCGNEEIENWLHHQLSDNASFEFSERGVFMGQGRAWR